MNPEEEKERALWQQQKYAEFKTELQQNETLKKFLEKAYPTSRDSFISDYAREKVQWMEYGPRYIEWLLRDDLMWVNDATKRLKEVLQKKLFDLQCRWRAEKIEIPEIKVSNDFYYWEDNILNCPFIDPVTREEADLYIQYLQSSNFENSQGWFSRWQDYQGIKAAYNDENGDRNFPDWYDFHNGRTGSSVYMLLPDIRGQKEEFYADLWRKEFHQKLEENKKEAEELKAVTEAAGIAPADDPEKRPFLDFHKKGWLTWFINTFDDKKTQEMFTRYGGERPFDDFDELLDDDLRLLSTTDKPVPIEGWFDWKEAVHRAAEKFSIEKIIEAMPLAFEQYRMNVDMKIAFEQKGKPPKDTDGFRNSILRGRELNGEPRNFDF